VPWTRLEDIPFTRYVGGRSRFDLATVRDYLLPDVKPRRFHLRRIGPFEWADVEQYLEEGRTARARMLAISLALVDVDGFEVELGTARPLSQGALARLRAALGDAEFAQLGRVCIAANRELTDAEKNL
jgi:hypothetical protein